MQSLRSFSLGTLLVAIVCLAPLRAGAATYDELVLFYDTQLATTTSTASYNFNGATIGYTVSGAGAPLVIIEDLGAGVIIYSGLQDRLAELAALAAYFGIPLSSLLTPSSIADPESAASMLSRQVFASLVMPAVAPQTEQQRTRKLKQDGKTRAFGGAIRTEWIDDDTRDAEGEIYSFNLGVAQDFDTITVGLFIPYDHLDFDAYDADHLGAILYGQYHLELNERWQAILMANANYAYTDINVANAADVIVNTGGGGLSASLSYVAESYEAGVAASWQYHHDDSNTDDDEQHMLRSGAYVGLHLTPNQSVTFSGAWAKDLTDYVYDYGDDDYFDLGVEYRADFFETWALSFGYKKIVDLDDYRSDMLYLGSSMQF